VIAGGSYFGMLDLGHGVGATGTGGYVAAIAPDGTGRWLHAVAGGQVASVATSADGTVAALLLAPSPTDFAGVQVTGWTLAMLDADGTLAWTRGLELAGHPTSPTLATDGADIWLAQDDAISRETVTATAWSTDATGVRVLGVGDTLAIELTASDGQLALDGRTFDGDGTIIASLVR